MSNSLALPFSMHRDHLLPSGLGPCPLSLGFLFSKHESQSHFSIRHACQALTIGDSGLRQHHHRSSSFLMQPRPLLHAGSAQSHPAMACTSHTLRSRALYACQLPEPFQTLHYSPKPSRRSALPLVPLLPYAVPAQYSPETRQLSYVKHVEAELTRSIVECAEILSR